MIVYFKFKLGFNHIFVTVAGNSRLLQVASGSWLLVDYVFYFYIGELKLGERMP